jgi:CheY-like chemotaxis protein/HPt (histidine-containing phosphotransfer) domain-containing protein
MTTDALVLIAEDDPTNQKVIKRQMQMLGYACKVADDGQQALDLWRTGRFAILLSDLHMPNLDGYDLAKQIRLDEDAQGSLRSPILALTANALKGEEERASACGFDAYLTKPIAMDELARHLAVWLSADHPRRERASDVVEPLPLRAEADCLDLDKLRALVGHDEEFVLELLIEFDASSRAMEASLRTGVEGMAYDQVRQVAHQLKSAARSVGAVRLGHCCESVEGCARAQQPMNEAVNALFVALKDVHGQLDQLIKEPAK